MSKDTQNTQYKHQVSTITKITVLLHDNAVSDIELDYTGLPGVVEQLVGGKAPFMIGGGFDFSAKFSEIHSSDNNDGENKELPKKYKAEAVYLLEIGGDDDMYRYYKVKATSDVLLTESELPGDMTIILPCNRSNIVYEIKKMSWDE